MTILKEVHDVAMIIIDLRERGVMRETLCQVAEDLVFKYNLPINKHEYIMDKIYDYIYNDDFTRLTE